jgi:lipoprotein-releasing system permease protein
MYKLQLIRKYLVKRRIAWVALLAVMLCTAMVLVVVSVMGGWLTAFVESYHGMTSDVIVSANSLAGFPNYQEMVDGIKKLPDAMAAVPIIRTGGLINIGNREVQMVQVVGYPQNIGEVNDWPSSLHLKTDDRRKELEAALATPGLSSYLKGHFTDDLKQLPFSLHPDVSYRTEWHGRGKGPDPRDRPGMIASSLLLQLPQHDGGQVADMEREFFYTVPVSLTLVPVKGNEQITIESVQPVPFWIVDDAKSRLWALDNNNVYISFDEAQRDLGMAEKPGEPARCSEIQIKARPGTNLNLLRDQIMKITDDIRTEQNIPPWYDFAVRTWEQQQVDFIDAVKHEVVLTTALFGIVSIVAVLMIFCIFYMIVIEKTKDIGILKSTGATGWGILQLFLGYGLAIGVVGAAMGFGAAFLIVRYINEIHAWLGRQMHIVIFKPETYQLDKIPSQMDTKTVIWVLTVAVLSALVGALIPAVRGANMNPVDALRYE